MNRRTSIFSFMRGNVVVLTLSRVLWTVPLSMSWPFFSPFIQALGGAPTEIGLVYAVGGLGGLLLFPVGGFLADQRGRVKLTALVTYALALSHIFFIVAQNWVTLAFGMFIQELLIFHLPALNALTADSLPPRKRGIGVATVNAIPRSIGLFATYVGGYIISFVFQGDDAGLILAMRVFFTVALFVGLLVATIRLKFLKETVRQSNSRISFREIPTILLSAYKNVFTSFKWMSQTLWAVAVLTTLITMFGSVASPFWAIFAIETIGLTVYEWGLLTFLVGVIQIPISIPLGHMVDVYGSRRTIVLAMLLAPIPILLFPLTQNFVQAFVTLFCLSIVNVLLWPASASLIANLIPKERRGRLISVLGQGLSIEWGGGGAMTTGFLLYLSRIAGSFIGGYIFASNPQHPWLILPVALAVCLVLSFRFIHESEEKET